MKSTDIEIEIHQGSINFLESLNIQITPDDFQYGYFTFDIEVTVTEAGNDGIGSYEFGSQRCFDSGSDTAEDFEVQITSSGSEFSEEVLEQIEMYLDQEIKGFDDILQDLANDDLDNYLQEQEDNKAEAQIEAYESRFDDIY